jgi:hypothetical protein
VDSVKVLTVIMRDDGPFVHAGGSPVYRTVQIVLTQDQLDEIKPRWQHDGIDRCFIEEKEVPRG